MKFKNFVDSTKQRQSVFKSVFIVAVVLALALISIFGMDALFNANNNIELRVQTIGYVPAENNEASQTEAEETKVVEDPSVDVDVKEEVKKAEENTTESTDTKSSDQEILKESKIASDSDKVAATPIAVPIAVPAANATAVLEVKDDNKTVTFYEGTGTSSETQKYYSTVFEAMAQGWSYSQTDSSISGEVTVKLLHDWIANEQSQFCEAGMPGFDESGLGFILSNGTIIDLNGFTIDGRYEAINPDTYALQFFDIYKYEISRFTITSSSADRGTIKNVLLTLSWIAKETLFDINNVNLDRVGDKNVIRFYNNSAEGSSTFSDMEIKNCFSSDWIIQSTRDLVFNNVSFHGNGSPIFNVDEIELIDVSICNNTQQNNGYSLQRLCWCNNCKIGGTVTIKDNIFNDQLVHGIVCYNLIKLSSIKDLNADSVITIDVDNSSLYESPKLIAEKTLEQKIGCFVGVNGVSISMGTLAQVYGILASYSISQQPSSENNYKVLLHDDVTNQYSLSYQWHAINPTTTMLPDNVTRQQGYYDSINNQWISDYEGDYFDIIIYENETLSVKCSDPSHKYVLSNPSGETIEGSYSSANKQWNFVVDATALYRLSEDNSERGTLENAYLTRESIGDKIDGQIYNQLFDNGSLPDRVVCCVSATPKPNCPVRHNPFLLNTNFIDVDKNPGSEPKGRYLVSFDANGGQCDVANSETANGVLKTLPEAKRNGLNFVGWFTDDNIKVEANKTVFTNDCTVHAKWDNSHYQVDFNMNGHGQQIDSIEIETGKTINKPQDPTDSGWGFMGWYKDAEFKSAWDFDNDTVTKDTTLYAKWVNAQKVLEISCGENIVEFCAVSQKDYSNETCFTSVHEAMARGWEYSQSLVLSDDTVTVKLFHDWNADAQQRFNTYEMNNFKWDGRGMLVNTNTKVDLNGYCINGGFSSRPTYVIDSALFECCRDVFYFEITSDNEQRGLVKGIGTSILSDNDYAQNDQTTTVVSNIDFVDNYFGGCDLSRPFVDICSDFASVLIDSIEVRNSEMDLFVTAFDESFMHDFASVYITNSKIHDNLMNSFIITLSTDVILDNVEIVNNTLQDYEDSGFAFVVWGYGSALQLGNKCVVSGNKSLEGTELGCVMGVPFTAIEDMPLTDDSSVSVQCILTTPNYSTPVSFADSSLKNSSKCFYCPDGYVVNVTDDGLEALYPIKQQPIADNDYTVMPHSELSKQYSFTYQWYTAKNEVFVTPDNAMPRDAIYDSQTNSWVIKSTSSSNTYCQFGVREGQTLRIPYIDTEERAMKFRACLITSQGEFDLEAEYDSKNKQANFEIPADGYVMLDEITGTYGEEVYIKDVTLEGVLAKDKKLEGQNFNQLYDTGKEFDGAICEVTAIAKPSAVNYNSFTALSEAVEIDPEHKPEPQTPGMYLVTFDAGEGECETLTSTTQNYVLNDLPTPKRSGYKFEGWYKDGSTLVVAGETTFSQNTTVTAQWSESTTLTVSFDAMGHGVAPQDQEVAYGAKITEPAAPSETGYQFEGWYKENTHQNIWDFQKDVVTENITLYAKWTPVTVTVEYDFQYSEYTPQQIDQTFGSTYVLPYDPEWEGHNFIGWFTEATGGSQVTSDTVVSRADDHTLYAHWEEVTTSYTVDFDVQGHGSAPESQTAKPGDKVVRPDIPTDKDYLFAAWYKDAECSDMWDFDNDTVSEDITLYAKWVKNEGSIIIPDDPNLNIDDMKNLYASLSELILKDQPNAQNIKVEVDSSKGAVSQDDMKVLQDNITDRSFEPYSITVKALYNVDGTDKEFQPNITDVPVRMFFDFDFTNKSNISVSRVFNGQYDQLSTTPSEDGEYYKTDKAKSQVEVCASKYPTYAITYKENAVTHTVSFDVQGHGSTPEPQTVEDGGLVAKPADPLVKGYTFEGWYKQPACIDAWDFDNDTVYADTTLYAKWTGVEVQVTFNSNNDNPSTETITQTYGSAYRLPQQNPEWQGHSFAGWYTDQTSGDQVTKDTIVANTEDHVVYAHWQEGEDVGPRHDSNGDSSSNTGDTNVLVLLGILSAAIAAAGTTVLVRRKLND